MYGLNFKVDLAWDKTSVFETLGLFTSATQTEAAVEQLLCACEQGLS